MELKAYSKNDLLQKLAQSGFFVDYLTLDSFLEKYKIEAIFEDENGNEFFDVSSFNILVKNVLNKNAQNNNATNSDLHSANSSDTANNVNSTANAVDMSQNEQNSQQVSQSNESSGSQSPKQNLLENIKWYRWDDISSDIADAQKPDDAVVIDKNQGENKISTSSQENFSDTPVNNSNITPSLDVQNDFDKDECDANLQDKSKLSAETKNEISKILSSTDDNEDDFDDIGLISDSLQVQEKFQKYIADELSKKSLIMSEPKQENAFKFDISEKTLNMIARTIAKKIAKQVSSILSGEQSNNAKLLEVQSKYSELEARANLLEEQNKKLKLLLTESNKNLNSYRPTFFGLYRFVRKKNKKRN